MAFSSNTGKGIGGSFPPMSEINVTPFVDVMLVLLVIFMVTAPMMVQGLQVQLPETKSEPVANAEGKLVLTLMRDHRVLIGDIEVPLAKLKDLLANNAKVKADKEVLLKADAHLSYGFVMKVMAMAKDGGAENIGMITEPEHEG